METIKDEREEDAYNEEAHTREVQVSEAVPAYKLDGYYTYSDYIT